MKVKRYTDKTNEEIRQIFNKMTNEEIINEYPTTIPTRLAAILMNISENDMRYGIASNHSKFQFGLSIQRKIRTEFRIDTKLFLEAIPQRKGK